MTCTGKSQILILGRDDKKRENLEGSSLFVGLLLNVFSTSLALILKAYISCAGILGLSFIFLSFLYPDSVIFHWIKTAEI